MVWFIIVHLKIRLELRKDFEREFDQARLVALSEDQRVADTATLRNNQLEKDLHNTRKDLVELQHTSTKQIITLNKTCEKEKNKVMILKKVISN